MASDPTLFILSQLTFPNLQLAVGIFLASFLLVRGAYQLRIVDEHSIQEDKPRKGTLAISTILLILGIFAMLILFTGFPILQMKSALAKPNHLLNVLVIASVIVFAYLVDFLKNMARIYDVKAPGLQKFLHLIVDLVNMVYGLSFTFFAVPVLYYTAFRLIVPGS